MSSETKESLSIQVEADRVGNDIVFRSPDMDFVNIHESAHDEVFEYVVDQLERFAYDWMSDGLNIGRSFWEHDGTRYHLTSIEIRQPVRDRYGHQNVSEEDRNPPPSLFD